MNIELIEKLLTLLVADENTSRPSRLDKCGLEGSYVIVRCRDAGVHAGTLVSLNARTAILKNSRRLWYWKAAGDSHSLSGVATHGITAQSKIPAMIDTVVLPEACEVLSTSEKCKTSIANAAEHEAN